MNDLNGSQTTLAPPPATGPPAAAPPADTRTATLPPMVRPGALPPGSPAPGPMFRASPPVETHGQKVASSGWRKPILFGVIALFVGVGIGYGAGMPAKSDMKSQRNEAIARGDGLEQQLNTANATLASTKTDLDATKADLSDTKATLATTKADLAATVANLASKANELSATQADLTKANGDLGQARIDLTQVNAELKGVQSDLTDMTANRDLCVVADQAAIDLVAQWENYFDDLYALVQMSPGSAESNQLLDHMDQQISKMVEQHDAMHELETQCRAG